MELLRGSFRPEFINRIDEIIVFRALSEEQLLDITRLLLDRLDRRLRAQRIEVEFSEEAVRLLAREGYDPEFGARPLRRTIQRLVENELPGWCSMGASSRATRPRWTWTTISCASRSRRARRPSFCARRRRRRLSRRARQVIEPTTIEDREEGREERPVLSSG